MFVHAVLIPFRDVIITDGLLESPPMQLSFGAGARRMFQDQYRKAHAASLIRTTLLPNVDPSTLVVSTRPGSPARAKTKAGVRGSSPSSEVPGDRFRGHWRIATTEVWGRDSLDLVQPAFLRFDDNRLGQLGMIAIRADLDCRYGDRDGKPLVEFTFEGDDDGHSCHGRGWAILDADGLLRGRLHIHQGDDSGFVAERLITGSRAPDRKRTRGARGR